MKIGTGPAADIARVRAAREAIGPDAGLFVDANGAYDRKQALAKAAALADFGVSWFEEPVSSDDLEGLRLVREHTPPGMRIAAGEYGYDSYYFRRMLDAAAVDVLQADAMRCGDSCNPVISGKHHACMNAMLPPPGPRGRPGSSARRNTSLWHGVCFLHRTLLIWENRIGFAPQAESGAAVFFDRLAMIDGLRNDAGWRSIDGCIRVRSRSQTN